MNTMKKAITANLGKFGLFLMVSMGAFLVFVFLFFPPSNLLQKGVVDEGDGDVAADDLHPTGMFDDKSCLSRRRSQLYRRKPAHGTSPSFVAKLRSYEDRHRRCGPHTESYNESVRALESGLYAPPSESGCSYVVWVPFDGLGNRILTLTAAFLYALLTDRVLLLDRGTDVADLFCEPFPDASWLLPLEFALADKFRSFDWWSHQTYGELLRDSNSTVLPSLPQPYMFLNLLYFNNDHDKHFFCDQDQAYLQKIPWLVIKSNVYFVPSFFLMPVFREELDRLFPDKEIVFHLLARYLIHPTNPVWGLVTRYYDAYLSEADTIVGIQVRVLGGDSSRALFNNLFSQITSCIARESILPVIGVRPSGKKRQSGRRVAVVVTSLASGYSEGLRELYWEKSTVTGDVINVFQPSNEGIQKTDKANHNQKAWAEIYLLSLTDKLVTSSWSTFGYVAQGLGGLRPWILDLPNNQTTPDPPCQRGVSMEPCFHGAPRYACGTTTRADSAVPHVRPCEDRPWDLKLFHG